MTTRPEIGMVDHATRVVHRAASGVNMGTDCGMVLADVTIGPRSLVERAIGGTTVCVDCWPMTHNRADVVTLAQCECGVQFTGDTEAEALAQWRQHADAADGLAP